VACCEKVAVQWIAPIFHQEEIMSAVKFFAPATLERYGCAVPQTWDEFFTAAAFLKEKSAGAIKGFT
jgi:hypothetical protein